MTIMKNEGINRLELSDPNVAERQKQKQQEMVLLNLRSCIQCGRSFSHKAYLDHLFVNKECMRKYWEEEDRNRAIRRRGRYSSSSSSFCSSPSSSLSSSID